MYHTRFAVCDLGDGIRVFLCRDGKSESCVLVCPVSWKEEDGSWCDAFHFPLV